MALYVVRHAKAGQRLGWDGDDIVRPLSKTGRAQADALAARLAPLGPTRLVSSPYLRCVQTLRPLADCTGLEVELDDRLAEAGHFEGALELLASLDDGAVLCSHGDVIPDLIDALHRRGMALTTEPDWRKATVWVIEREGAARGHRVTSAAAWPPPAS